MGRIIRSTVTITITESWTIVWTDDIRADDPSQPQATTIVQEQPKTQEEQDEALQTTLTDADPGDPSASNPTATPLTPTAATDPQLDGVSARPSASSQRKRTRRRRAT